MHQRLERAGDEAIVDEEILLDAELRIAALEVARAVLPHAMAQHEVLSARGRADRVGLHEGQLLERALQAGGRREAARHGKVPEIVEADRHGFGLVQLRSGKTPGIGPR